MLSLSVKAEKIGEKVMQCPTDIERSIKRARDDNLIQGIRGEAGDGTLPVFCSIA